MKKRNFTTLVYPDSAPADWLDQLQQTGLACAVSPLHDKDSNPDGEVKKAHYHLLICFEGPTTLKNAQELSNSILSGVLVKPIESVRGMYRYLTHEDNPEKFHYDKKDIVLLNGFDPQNVLSNSDESEIADRVIQIINDNHIKYYHDLIDYLRSNSLTEEKHVAMSKIMLFTSYLNSMRFKKKDNLEVAPVKVDVNTGEVIF